MSLRAAPPAVFAVLVLATLAGCGGSGADSSSSSTTAAQSTTRTSPASGTVSTSSRETSNGGGGASSHDGSTDTGQPLTAPGPLPNEGTAAVAPGVPTVKGGDNSIQTFGTEADTSQRIAIAREVKAFLDAEAAGNWSKACTYLATFIRQKFGQVAKQAPQAEGSGCGAGMALMLTQSSAPPPKATNVHVLSLRTEGPLAFVVYRDATNAFYNLPLRREGGRWRFTAPAGIALSI